MKRALAAACLAAAPLLAAAQERTWSFRVLLDGREIGSHAFTLVQRGEERELSSEARFEVSVLFVKAFRYSHRAEERWRGDCLVGLQSRTETNGAREWVAARREAGRLVVERPAGREEHDGCPWSFAYWNPAIVGATRLLNTQTGEMVPVAVRAMGAERVPVRGRPLEAQRHRITGPGLAIDLWYAGAEWVALESATKQGGRLRYELL